MDVSGKQWQIESCFVFHCLEGKYRPIFLIDIGGRVEGQIDRLERSFSKVSKIYHEAGYLTGEAGLYHCC